MAEQLSFSLPSRPALERADFFVSPSNALAVALIDTHTSWPAGKLVLVGPQGAGKTHLAHVWAHSTGAQIIAAQQLTEAQVPALATGSVALEDADRIAGDAGLETALFHLHNLMAAEGQPLLMTARSAPPHWGLTLPDLASRLGAVQNAALEAPDDALLAAVMMKLFADRQMRPAPDVIPYLSRRIDRSFAAAAETVALLDREALAQSRDLTRAFAAQVLDKAVPSGS